VYRLVVYRRLLRGAKVFDSKVYHLVFNFFKVDSN
jgi:hypothetical protein